MDLTVIKERLLKDNCNADVINLVVANITANIHSFTYANESLDELAVFLVFKNTGGCKVFKTIGDHIIMDKLDTAYSESRELIGIGNWNLKKAYRVCFVGAKEIVMREVDAKEIHKVLFALIEPASVKYVMGVEVDNIPTTISVDCASYKGLSYKELKDCIISSYKNSLKKNGKSTNFLTEPSCYVVSYAAS